MFPFKKLMIIMKKEMSLENEEEVLALVSMPNLVIDSSVSSTDRTLTENVNTCMVPPVSPKTRVSHIDEIKNKITEYYLYVDHSRNIRKIKYLCSYVAFKFSWKVLNKIQNLCNISPGINVNFNVCVHESYHDIVDNAPITSYTKTRSINSYTSSVTDLLEILEVNNSRGMNQDVTVFYSIDDEGAVSCGTFSITPQNYNESCVRQRRTRYEEMVTGPIYRKLLRKARVNYGKIYIDDFGMGPEYSSDEAGDGPWTFFANKHDLHTIFQQVQFGDEIIFRTLDTQILAIISIMEGYILVESTKYRVNLIRTLKSLTDWEVCFHFETHTQLGVEYSSNNAGDGPNMINKIITFVMDAEANSSCIMRDHLGEIQGIIEKMPSGATYIFCLNTELDMLLTEIYQFDNDVHIILVNHRQFLMLSQIQNSTSKEWIIDLVEDIGVLLYYFSKATCKTDFLIPIVAFIKSRTKGSLILTLTEQALWQKFTSLFYPDEDEIPQQSFEDLIGSFRDYYDNFTMIQESEFAKKMKKFVLYALSTSLFDKIGITFDTFNYTVFEEATIKRKFNNKLGLIKALTDLTLFICEKGIQIYKTGDAYTIFHSSKNYLRWKGEFDRIVRQQPHLSRAKELGFSEEEFDRNLDIILSEGLSIQKYAPDLGKFEKDLVDRHINVLLSIKDDRRLTKCISEEREVPFSILINSTSGVGKGTIKEMLFKAYAKHNKMGQDPGYKYVRCPDDEFWSGYETHKYCVIMDDVAFINPSAAQGVDPTCMEFLKVVNSVPYVTNQAALEDKGKIPLKCKLVLATTNVEDLNAYYYFSCPSAVQRRFPYIVEPKVREEFATSGGMLDTSRTTLGEIPDYWTWTVKRVEPQPDPTRRKQLADTTLILQDASLNEFNRWYHEAMDEHNMKTQVMKESLSVIDNLQVCYTCYRYNCEIDHTQSTELYAFEAMVFVRSFIFIMLYIYISWIHAFLNSSIFRGVARLFRVIRYTNQLNNSVLDFASRMDSIWVRIGYRQYKRLSPNSKFLLAIAAALATVASSCALTNLILGRSKPKKSSRNQQSEEHCCRPIPDDKERPNVWYQKEFGLSEIDTPISSRSISTINRDQLFSIIEKNIVRFKKVDNGQSTNAVCLKGNLYVFNAHFIKEESCRVHCGSTSRNQVSDSVQFILDKKNITIDFKSDLAFVRINKLPPKKDITKYIPSKYLNIQANGFYVLKRKDYSCGILPVTKIRNRFIENRNIETEGWEGNVGAPTDYGDCGSILVMESARGPLIVGIHAIGLASYVASVSLTLEKISKVVNLDEEVEISEPMLQSETASREITNLHRKSVFRYLEEGSAEVYGTFVGHRGNNKSSVEETPISKYMQQVEGVTIKYTKPDMRTYRPWRIAAKEMVDIPNFFNTSILNECVDNFTNEILERLPKNELKLLSVYDTFTSVNGAAGVAYVDKINRNTSAGNPWRKSKRHYLINVPPEGELLDPMMPTQEILDRVDQIETLYKKGHVVKPNFCAHLKDEPVSFKKADIGKTRVFTGAPFDWSIVVRKYLLSFIRVLQRNRFIFEAAPGTIAQSKEWGDIYHYLTEHGRDKIVAGDYKAFDKRMQPEFILGAYKIIANVLKMSGNYTDEQLKVIKCIAYDTAFPLVDFNGDLVQFYGSNPSGHPLTVIINSLVNSLYMRYCYYILNPKKECATFKTNVNLLTYGDDNIMGVNSKINWFNHTTISRTLDSIGITYTMADKESESVPYICIDEATFLKRSWRFDHSVDNYLAPLELDSIEKMLTVWTRSRSVTESEQIMSVISSACREYFFYGKEIFETKRNMFQDIINRHNLRDWQEDWVLPTHSQLVENYNEINELL
jgi:DNA-binding cell septation regulator SpoVG